MPSHNTLCVKCEVWPPVAYPNTGTRAIRIPYIFFFVHFTRNATQGVYKFPLADVHNLFRFECVCLCVWAENAKWQLLSEIFYSHQKRSGRRKLMALGNWWKKKCFVFEFANWMVSVNISGCQLKNDIIYSVGNFRRGWTNACDMESLGLTLFCTSPSNRPKIITIKLILYAGVGSGGLFTQFQSHFPGIWFFWGEKRVTFRTKCQIISTMFLPQANAFHFFYFFPSHAQAHGLCMILCILQRAHDAEQIKMTFTHIRITK